MKKTSMTSSLLVLTGTLCCFLLAQAADWPQWRGPHRDGLSPDTGLLKEWPADGPPLAWKATGIGEGYGTVAIVGQRIYVQGDKGDKTYLHALNRADGKLLWSTPFGKSGAPGWGGFAGPRCTPTVDGNLVFVVAQFGEIACLDAQSGKILWQKDYEKDFQGVRPEWGFAASPLVDGDRVVFAPGGKLGNIVALNKQNGELVWRSKDFQDEHHYASLIPVEIGGVRQYLQLTARSIAGLAAADGALLWRADRRGATAVIPDPVYYDGHVYVTSGYGIGCNLFKITAAGGKFSAEQVWANKVMVNHHGGVVRLGEYVYGFSDGKGWTCQNFKTGEATWQEKEFGKGCLVYADGHLIIREERKSKGLVALLEANPQTYKVKGKFTPPDQSGKENWPHPVVLDGRLYLRDQDVLLCYDVKAR
ncbi:MAG: PQQ-like beta-propeller repeat protein [Verrucomicrobiae bacterium]|nr:PQQ-like beta-propeller repeat protein [Verrucomicrobiae bacterium]